MDHQKKIDGVALEFVDPPEGFPTSVTLMCQTWNIYYCSNLISDLKHHGLTVSSERAIYLDSIQVADILADTLVHELLHAMLDMGDVGMDIEAEERLVRVLAPKLIDWIRGNNLDWTLNLEES